jgi:hypothetical protein
MDVVFKNHDGRGFFFNCRVISRLKDFDGVGERYENYGSRTKEGH